MLIGERLRETAARHGEREAAVAGPERVSWAALDALADRAAALFAASGVGAGDRVAIQLPNVPSYLVAWYGILRLGAVAVPLNPRYRPHELEHLLADSAVVAAVAHASLAPILDGLRPRLPALRHVFLSRAGAPGQADGGSAFEDLVAAAAVGDGPWRGSPPVAGNAPATCLYTAGTTGRPKGALLSHEGLLWNIDRLLEVFTAGPEDRFLCALPLFHSYAQMACVIATLALGASLVVLPQFRPEAVLETIRKERITIFPGVPAFYGALLAAMRAGASADLGSLRLAVTGGAAMPVPVIEALEQRGVMVLEGNGPTEAGPVAYVNPERGPRKHGSVGPPIPGAAVRVVDDSGADLPTGEVGEILIRAPSVMIGYLNRPDATAQVLRDGWLYTGDLGRCDEDGYVYLVDRKTDLIIVGGLNVYPREVEEALLRHPAVSEAAVVGVPEETRGERVVAFVVCREGGAATPRALLRHCRTQLAPYKCPRAVLLVPELPKNAAGKVEKMGLRVLAQERATSTQRRGRPRP